MTDLRTAEILLQEDDASLDAREVFERDFERMFHISFSKWKSALKNVSKFDDMIMFDDGTITASLSAHDPYWMVCKS